jgi:hypothetical protein
LLIHFLTYSYFFFFPSFSYMIWIEGNLFAYSFSNIQLFFLLCFIFIYNMKFSKSICLFIFSHTAISFPLLYFHTIYEVRLMDLLIHWKWISLFIFQLYITHALNGIFSLILMIMVTILYIYIYIYDRVVLCVVFK